jgi:2-polyprenyl-6-methoxyphenol hydroxylase-like FAD-dependent oxidoreductase
MRQQPDVRISAISAASVDLLRGLGVWDAVLAMRAHPYSRLETWEWENAHVAFDAAELKLPRWAIWWKTTSCSRRSGRRWRRIRR